MDPEVKVDGMKADDVKPGMRNLDLEVKVVDVGEAHTFEREGEEGRVVTAVCEDDSGSVRVGRHFRRRGTGGEHPENRQKIGSEGHRN